MAMSMEGGQQWDGFDVEKFAMKLNCMIQTWERQSWLKLPISLTMSPFSCPPLVKSVRTSNLMQNLFGTLLKTARTPHLAMFEILEQMEICKRCLLFVEWLLNALYMVNEIDQRMFRFQMHSDRCVTCHGNNHCLMFELHGLCHWYHDNGKN